MSGDYQHIPLRLEGIGSTGVWGAVMAAVSTGAILLFLLYGYYYLDVSNEPFLPDHLAPPPVLLPAVLLGAMAITVMPASRVIGATARHDAPGIARGLAAVAVAGTAFLVLGAAIVRGQGLSPTENAYSASVVLVLGFHGVATLSGVVIAGYVAFSAVRMLDHPWLLSAAAVSVIWWCYIVLGWLAVGFSIYGYPQLALGTT